MTELEKELQRMAVENWEQFAELIGDDCVRDAKICLLRQRGASYGAIKNKLGITKRQAERGAHRCCPTNLITVTIESYSTKAP